MTATFPANLTYHLHFPQNVVIRQRQRYARNIPTFFLDMSENTDILLVQKFLNMSRKPAVKQELLKSRRELKLINLSLGEMCHNEGGYFPIQQTLKRREDKREGRLQNA